MKTINGLNEIKNNLKKGIEVLGGNDILCEDIDNIILNAFISEEGKVKIGDNYYSGQDIMKNKVQYEKYILLNKKKYIEKITYKIDKYDKELEKLLKLYNNTQSIEDYNKIIDLIEKNYAFDIDNFILANIQESIDRENIYGEYLMEKRNGFIKDIFFKLIKI